MHTDRTIQKIIKEEFKDCTVICIAHRLETILDSDRVAILEHGELVEFDRPSTLLEAQSKFRELYSMRTRD